MLGDAARFGSGVRTGPFYRSQFGKRSRAATFVDFRHHLDYGPTLGLPDLRDAIAQHVRQFRGVAIATRNVIVVEGTQVALRLIADVLSAPGQRIVLEDPSYLWAPHLFELLGLEVMPVDVDDQGLRIEHAPAASLAYVTPSHQFPLGCVMSRGRRGQNFSSGRSSTTRT